MNEVQNAQDGKIEASRANSNGDCFVLAHSKVYLENGPAGVLARVERYDVVEYAGPLPQETIEALAEVVR